MSGPFECVRRESSGLVGDAFRDAFEKDMLLGIELVERDRFVVEGVVEFLELVEQQLIGEARVVGADRLGCCRSSRLGGRAWLRPFPVWPVRAHAYSSSPKILSTAERPSIDVVGDRGQSFGRFVIHGKSVLGAVIDVSRPMREHRARPCRNQPVV
jgi:hypothetical protein